METKFKQKFRKITTENVKDIGEMIAIHAMKITMAYSGKALDDLYAGLIHDVFDYKPIGMTFNEIAELLSVNLSTVWRRRQQLQQKYVAVIR